MGQDQDTFGGSFEADQAFSGEVASLDIFSRILEESEIEAMAGCKMFDLIGDLLSLSDLREWEVSPQVIIQFAYQ